jgi:hypothetical protein
MHGNSVPLLFTAGGRGKEKIEGVEGVEKVTILIFLQFNPCEIGESYIRRCCLLAAFTFGKWKLIMLL